MSRRLLGVRSGRVSKPATSFQFGPTRLERFEALARLPETPYRWIVGHGQMTSNSPMVLPRRTYVVYLSAPGWLLSMDAILTSAGLVQKLRTRKTVMRRFILGQIPTARLTSTQFIPTNWRRHLYGPGDSMPNHNIEMFDRRRPDMDALMGLQEVGQPTTEYGRATTVAQLVREYGPGIYFVMACRGTPGQNTGELYKTGVRNVSTGVRFGRGQLGQPPVNRSGLVQRTYLQNTARTEKLKKRIFTVRPRTKVKFLPLVVRKFTRVGNIIVRRRPRPRTRA
jgi:hypothetical protein